MYTEARKKVRGVFFDLYGTLLILGNMKQAWTDWMEVLYAALCPVGSSLSKSAFDDCCHQFFGKDEPEPADDGLTVFERRIRRLANSLELAMEAAELKAVATRATNAWQAHVMLDPAALEVLTVLRQSKTLALISNFDQPTHVYRVLREAGLDGFFERIVVSGEVGMKKPDPGIFRIALGATCLSAEEVVYVGDTQEDVKGATAAGIRPILLVRPEDPSQPRILDYTRREEQVADRGLISGSQSVMTIGSLREIFAIVESLCLAG